MGRTISLAIGSLALSAAMMACTQVAPPPPPPPPPSVASVVLEPGSVLLENINATQQLSAKALDAQGNVVAATISFESSKPNVVSVSANGAAQGLVVGSSVLRARVGSVVSGPVIAAVGALNDAVVRIASDNIVSGPAFLNDCGPFDIGCQYTAVLKNVTPTTGKLWFSKNANGTPVQGKVVSSQVVADGTEVTFEVVPMQDLFKDLKVDEAVDLPSSDLVIPEALRATYNVQRAADGSYQFSPKDSSVRLSTLDFENGFLKCKGSLPQTAVTFGQPSFTLNLGSPHFEFGFQVPIPFVTAGSARFLFTAHPSLSINSGTHTLNANFNNQSLRCTFKNGISQPFQALGFGFTAKLVPGVSLGGSFGAGSASFALRLNVASNVRLGFDCRPPAGCTNLTQGNAGTVRGQATLSSIGNLAATIRDLNAGAFANVSISADAPIIGSLNLFNFTEGYAMDFDLATLERQISDSNPADYALRETLQIDPFASIKSVINFLLGSGAANGLGLNPISFNIASVQSPLVQSATLSSRTVSVRLDPDRINFFGTIAPFGLLYNVQKVQLRQTNGSSSVVLDEQTASSGQTSFSLTVPKDAALTNLIVDIVPVVLSAIPIGTVPVQ